MGKFDLLLMLHITYIHFSKSIVEAFEPYHSHALQAENTVDPQKAYQTESPTIYLLRASLHAASLHNENPFLIPYL